MKALTSDESSLEGRVLPRKVQKLGTSSLIITLPRDWARSHGLKAGSMVTIVEDGDRLVVIPYVKGRPLTASFSLKHLNICKHLGRVVFCAYLSGLDGLTFYSNRPIRADLVEKISRVSETINNDSVKVYLNNMYEVNVAIEEYRDDIANALANYGRSLASAFSRLSQHVAGIRMTEEELESIYSDLRGLAFRTLRSGAKGVGYGISQEHLNRLLMAGVGLMVLVNDSFYKLGKDLLTLDSQLTQDERERVKFLFQVLEVSLVAASLGVEPPSIKKEEDAYFKLRSLLDLEGELSDIVRNSTAAYAYILAKTLDIARIIKNIEETLLCHALFKKYSESEQEI
ncbi:AbrB/MazE/SpoVT family DNA-binding domain-containing protein [Acidilobus sp.]|uniref:AbrB/MazE/SpoVT family DNA-binding domain-containing protein n=1 Tax=Acidilobus sp. TaxID=1872109 RepID=UPI003D0913E0